MGRRRGRGGRGEVGGEEGGGEREGGEMQKRGEARKSFSWSLPKMPQSIVHQFHMHMSIKLGTKVLTRDMTAASSLISLLYPANPAIGFRSRS